MILLIIRKQRDLALFEGLAYSPIESSLLIPARFGDEARKFRQTLRVGFGESESV